MVRGIVGEYPGEHRVLHQVVGRPTGQAVKLHQVLEVAQSALVKLEDTVKPFTELPGTGAALNFPLLTKKIQTLSQLPSVIFNLASSLMF
jgi:hypothetical protein